MLDVDVAKGRVSLTMRDPNKAAAPKQRHKSKPKKSAKRPVINDNATHLGGIQIRRRKS